MGTTCFINVYERVVYDEGAFTTHTDDHLLTIMRTADGDLAFDAAMQFCDVSTVVNGSYDGMPDGEYNGAGHFAIALLEHVRDDWQKYTTICREISLDDIDGDDILLNIYVPEEGRAITDNDQVGVPS